MHVHTQGNAHYLPLVIQPPAAVGLPVTEDEPESAIRGGIGGRGAWDRQMGTGQDAYNCEKLAQQEKEKVD